MTDQERQMIEALAKRIQDAPLRKSIVTPTI
jgi:hypothetical protein